MKKSPLLALSLLACVFTLNAQEISFTFTANQTCEYAPLDSVLVENLTQGGDTVLYYPDTVLSIYTSIEIQTAMENNFLVSQNYPNPFSSKTKIDMFVPGRDDFTINVYDVTGRQITTYENNLERGMHNFTLNAGNSNNYILTVNSTKYVQKKMMICVGADDNSAARITYNGIMPEKKSILKSGKSDFVYDIDDALKFTGYVEGDFEDIMDTPTTDNDYLFDINNTVPSVPTDGPHVPGNDTIEWNWNTVSGATGYKYNDSNNYSGATDNGTSTSYTQTGLDCETAYTLYVWAYNDCGGSSSFELTETTTACPEPCAGVTPPTYDGHTYEIIGIGNQCWLVENLNVTDGNTDQSCSITRSCYDNNTSNCDTYGGLYTWDDMMCGESSSSANPSGVQGICPDGWHIPSDDEWQELEGEVDATYDYDYSDWNNEGCRGDDVGSALAGDASLWSDDELEGHASFGTSGFNALPGGRETSVSSSTGLSEYAYWWTTDVSTLFPANAYFRSLYFTNTCSTMGSYAKTSGLSVRCVKD
ncbi:MAG: FISUMP domain-containing protein [Candidatus Delongbacteria bacterium]|jgi:uncharacterized protein (TIGR02145 family)|nr:FISUMP domain-containing protein [Candidatus Delongbacteria bacterium]